MLARNSLFIRLNTMLCYTIKISSYNLARTFNETYYYETRLIKNLSLLKDANMRGV